MTKSISQLVSEAIHKGIHGFDHFEVRGERRIPGQWTCEPVSDADAQCWAVFGRIPDVGMWSINEFPTRRQAEEYLAKLVELRFGRKS